MRVATAIALYSLALGAQAAEPIERTFADWSLACDNVRSCVAIGVDENRALAVRIERDAGPSAALRVEIHAGFEETSLDRLYVDGRELATPAQSWPSMDDARRTRDTATALAFIDEVRNGSVLSTSAHPGESDPQVSLRGLSAALLLMDEAQDRLDTRTAALRRGTRAEGAVRAKEPLPVLHAAAAPKPLTEADANRIAAAVRLAQADRLAQEDCDEDIGTDQAFALTDDEALVVLQCWRGAYQESGLPFRTPRGSPEHARPIVLDTVGGDTTDLVTSADYDPATGVLHHFAKGRGLGDCGEVARWVFDGERFRLARYARMDRCAGLLADRWPVLWRATIEARE